MALFVLTSSGLPAVAVERQGFSCDRAALGMMLGAVSDFVRDSIHRHQKAGGSEILRVAEGARGFCAVRSSSFEVVAVHEGRETEAFLEDLRALARDLERLVGRQLREWDGNRALLSPASSLFHRFLGWWSRPGERDAGTPGADGALAAVRAMIDPPGIQAPPASTARDPSAGGPPRRGAPWPAKRPASAAKPSRSTAPSIGSPQRASRGPARTSPSP
jgi:hypothetical protein